MVPALTTKGVGRLRQARPGMTAEVLIQIGL